MDEHCATAPGSAGRYAKSIYQDTPKRSLTHSKHCLNLQSSSGIKTSLPAGCAETSVSLPHHTHGMERWPFMQNFCPLDPAYWLAPSRTLDVPSNSASSHLAVMPPEIGKPQTSV